MRRLRASLLTTALLASLAIGAAHAESVTPKPAAKKCLVIGHRGNSVMFFENTMPSFESAFAVGADMVEMDVRLTRDKVPVIAHDEELEFTTSTHGRVSEMTLAELKKVKAGSLRDETMTDLIPTLEEALLSARDRGRVLLDIKQDGMGAIIASVFERNGLPQEMAAIGTWTTAQADEYLQHMPRAQILDTREVPADWNAEYIAAQKKRGVDTFELWVQNAPPGFIAEAHAQGMTVYVYTVNSAVDMRRLIALGVDGIETDVPELLKILLEESESRSSLTPRDRRDETDDPA